MAEMSSRALRTLLLAAACTLAPGLAEAGIYKCTGPDGKTRYTSDPSHCPNAERQVLKKKVQKVIEADAHRRRAPRPARARASRGGDGLEAMWKGKRPAAERRLEDVEQRLARMQNVIKGCNRGSEFYTKDEAGIRRHISCEDLREKREELRTQHQSLVEYLADGLEDECRRGGCQPGWIR
jgi:hypothetical protein